MSTGFFSGHKLASPIVGVLLLGTVFVVQQGIQTEVVSASISVSQCRYAQLEVAVSWGPGAAAGHIAVPFIIANISQSTCYLPAGYPSLRLYTAGPSKHNLHVTKSNGSFMFARVKISRIVLPPGRDASFGMSFVDVLNQQYKDSPSCMVQFIYVALPVAALSENYETTNNFNICYSGFSVQVTPMEAGPYPKLP